MNSYYPGSGSAGAGTTTVTVGSKSAGSASASIAAGDLVLIMQMQDGSGADLTEAASYGSSGVGTAGQYEYASVRAVSGGTLTLGSALNHSYLQNFSNRQTFQVVRVPQYSSATVSGTLTAQPWTTDASGNGTGGVLALDVAGSLTLNANLDVSGKGFRGASARNVSGNLTSGLVYRYPDATVGSYKGEGTAGTPGSMFVGSTTLATATTNYTNGDAGRGAPGNAGGGANDGQPNGGGNQYNAGGGGGGNAGAGGKGGYSWSIQNDAGGLGGKATAPSSTRLVLGGGGGAGGSNNNSNTSSVTTYPPNASGGGADGPVSSSGASGGGIVMVRTGSLAGTGRVNANGYRAYNVSGGSEAAGGGGAGGSVMLLSASSGSGPAVSVTGGAGGNSNYYHHGPGGGGGGGYVLTSSNLSPAISQTGGSSGVDGTAGDSTGYTTNADGSVVGNVGAQNTVASTVAACLPALTVSKSTSTATRTLGTDTTATYTVTVSNSGGGATGVSVTDPLPTPFSYNGAAITPSYSGGASGPTSVTGSGTTTAVFGTAGGDTTISFSLPQGGSVALTFTVNLNGAASGTFQNPASTTFTDPTRTTATQTVSPGGTYAGGGTVDGSNYASTSSTAEDVRVNAPPTTGNVVNTVLLDTAPATALNPNLSATDSDGTIATYTILTLPAVASGVLALNGAAVTAGQSLTPSQLAQLTFDPAAGFNGNASFTYRATDNLGAVSNTSTYIIPVNVAPMAYNDVGATNPNVSVTFSVTGNDTDTPSGTVDVTTTAFDASSSGVISGGGKTLTISGEGVYTLDNSGNVTFAPAAGFNNGTSTAKYTVKDNQGAVSNVATITVTVPASVDLAIAKTGPGYFKPGDTLTYTLTVTDSGSAATGVKVTDTLPGGLTFASASSGGSYDSGTGKVTWTLGNVAAGSTTTLTLSGAAPSAASIEMSSGPTSLSNTASVAGNETEVVTSNNAASSAAQLVYPKLSKRVRNVTQNGVFGTVGSGRPGEVLEYCVDFKNYGVAVAGFAVSDTVPGNTAANLSAYGAGLGLQVVRNSATTTRTSSDSDTDGGSLSATALSLALGTLAAGESGSVCFQASIR